MRTRSRKGEYLLHAGGCISCHTGDEEGAHPLAGGHALESPFGVFYSPNITPDLETGIGAWTDEDFLTAFWEGENPDGDHYFPAFPYTAYTGMSREDVLALKAYLFSVEPVRKENKEHDLWAIMSSRFSAGVWKARYFDAERFEPDPQQAMNGIAVRISSGTWATAANATRRAQHWAHWKRTKNWPAIRS